MTMTGRNSGCAAVFHVPADSAATPSFDRFARRFAFYVGLYLTHKFVNGQISEADQPTGMQNQLILTYHHDVDPETRLVVCALPKLKARLA